MLACIIFICCAPLIFYCLASLRGPPTNHPPFLSLFFSIASQENISSNLMHKYVHKCNSEQNKIRLSVPRRSSPPVPSAPSFPTASTVYPSDLSKRKTLSRTLVRSSRSNRRVQLLRGFAQLFLELYSRYRATAPGHVND